MFLFSSSTKKPAASTTHSTTAAPPPPRSQRLAALTYLTAPYPSESADGIFDALLLLAADKVDVSGASVEQPASGGSWLGRVWRRATDYSAAQLLQSRQEDFLAAFSRQLELNPAEETSVVMLSCNCYAVSNGALTFGTLYATNCGLYFCTPSDPGAAPSTAGKSDAASSSSSGSDNIEATTPERIKERVLFTDMASFLPSIFLPQKDVRAPPFIQGVPSGVVTPNALQVFTVRLSTVLQFLDFHNMAIKPPRKTAAERDKGGPDSAPEAPCTDVVRKREHALIAEFPASLNTLTFCALLWRLWTERLRELDLPLEHPQARYAEPH